MRGRSDHSSAFPKRIDRGSVAKTNQRTNWKGEYRLQHNWSKGTCRVTEIEVAGPSRPPIVVKLDSGIVFTADTTTGLRAWSISDTKTCLASTSFSELTGDDGREDFGECTAITITPGGCGSSHFEVTIGFDSGGIAVYSFSYDHAQAGLRLRSSHFGLLDGSIASLASCKGYLLALSEDQTLSLFELYHDITPRQIEHSVSQPPRLIASLAASNIQAPFSLSVRARSEAVTASIAYSFPRIGCGWSVGLQELRWNKNDGTITSRLTSTVESQFALGELSSFPTSKPSSFGRVRSNGDRYHASGPSLSFTRPPTSLSYSHPYLITSHADNTLTMYLVVSGANDLTVKAGHRLWGHTSCVSGVQVSGRGKAISVSRRGDEIRIWELEELASSRPKSKRALTRDKSVQLSPERPRWQAETTTMGCDLSSSEEEAVEDRKLGFKLALEQGRAAEPAMMNLKGWVEFDDERVIVLREQEQTQEPGAQLLDCYDFT